MNTTSTPSSTTAPDFSGTPGYAADGPVLGVVGATGQVAVSYTHLTLPTTPYV